MSIIKKINDYQIFSQISQIIYRFLPGEAHPYADQTISYHAIAQELGINNYWNPMRNKTYKIQKLLLNTFRLNKSIFPKLISEIINRGTLYTANKGEIILLEEILKINNLFDKINYKDPLLTNLDYLNTLQPIEIQAEIEKLNRPVIPWDRIIKKFEKLFTKNPQQRGFDFEKFLNKLFKQFNLEPRQSFKIKGEQIDGSIELNTAIYLIEAKWKKKLVSASELYIFQEKIERKSAWTRGIFISVSGFSEEGLQAYKTGKSTKMILVSGQDLRIFLDKKYDLSKILEFKVRIAAEEGKSYISVVELEQKYGYLGELDY